MTDTATRRQSPLPQGAPTRPSALRRAARRPDTMLFLVLVGVVIAASAVIVNFATTVTLGFLLVGIVPVLLLAMPMTLIIVTGEIDLSVASTAGLTSAVMGVLWRDTDLGIWTIIVCCLLVGALCGAFNGLLITGLGVSSLAVTIGTLALFRGLALVVIGDQKVSDFPADLTRLATQRIGDTGIPVVMLGVAVVVAVFAVVLHQTSFGRTLYALGFSPEAARFVGVRVGAAKFWLFVVSGAVSGLVGVYWTLRFASAGPDNATGLELSVIAAVLLGGVSIFGGRGTVFGVVTGVLLIGTVTYALRLARVDETTLPIVTGVLLVLSVVTPSALGWAREKRRLSRLTTSSPAAPAAG
ncbi:ABC transporter permease [Nocardioides kribbensis]|uniref:ABC transporter permease n=1 Tax=Nocardioides kribbensis TaxID=305517 RepID=UPI0018793696|nr:ABC transporter permease [Nocardioides kribbensis]